MVSSRFAFKKETLLKNLSSVVARIPKLDLPASIEAIYVFGGMLREKDKLHDIDAVFLYSQNKEQSLKWKSFRNNFNNLVQEKQSKSPIDRVWTYLKPYYLKKVPLSRAVKTEKLSKILSNHGIEPAWAGCFSWMDIVNNPHGVFTPFIDVVLQKSILSGTRGLSAIFITNDDFTQERSGYSLNTALAWSPGKPDIEANLFGRTSAEKKMLILKELELFSNVLSDQGTRYLQSKKKLAQAPFKLNFDNLEKEHAEIVYNDQDTYAVLLEKCERAREQMRRYEEELSLLNTIESVLERWENRESAPIPEYSIEEQIGYLALLWQPKYKVDEQRIRELLRMLGLPEDKVQTVKRPGGKTVFKLTGINFKQTTSK